MIAATMTKLIVALDVPGRDAALDLARRLRDHVALVKVGLEGFVAHGPGLVRDLTDLGLGVFLDLKLHDIPRTAAAAAREASALGAKLLTVHAAGGAEMVRAVRDAASPETAVIAVTLLTSLDDASAARIGFARGVSASARALGELARSSGADGLVCSAHELPILRSLGGTRVVPGIRPSGAAAEDQRRTATPAGAARAGATWIVVGRPIIAAADPAAAAKAVAAELAAAWNGDPGEP